jgi:hypothetical protein
MPAEHSIPEDKPRRTIIIVVALVAAVLIGGFFYLLMRSTTAPPAAPILANAIRAGSPEFDQYKAKILIDKPEATQATNALGGFQMFLETTVRNFTGRTITGLELRGAVLNKQGLALKDRTVVVVPTKQGELETNKTLKVTIPISGLKEKDERASLLIEVTGFTLR